MKYLNVCDIPDSGIVTGEKNFSPSLTVPDMSLSVRDILERFVTGRSFDSLMLNGEFTDDMDDLRGLDLVELQQLKSDVNERINYLTDSLKEEDFPPVVVPDVVSDDDNNE